MNSTYLVTDAWEAIQGWSHAISQLYMDIDQQSVAVELNKRTLFQMYNDFARIIDNLKAVESEMKHKED